VAPVLEIRYLILKEIQLEWRNKYAFNGILLFIISTIFIGFLSFKRITHPATWNALFWIVMLFSSVNAVAKSFLQDSSGRLLYYYSLVSPQAVILSKTIYNSMLMCLLSLAALIVYVFLIGNVIKDIPLFLTCVLLGNVGFASVLTFISAIASKAGHNSTLMAILSFPVLIPLLITIMKFSKNAIDGLERSVSHQYIVILAAINLLVVALSYMLFPYLWRD
jgi:heme exporter protein B